MYRFGLVLANGSNYCKDRLLYHIILQSYNWIILSTVEIMLVACLMLDVYRESA